MTKMNRFLALLPVAAFAAACSGVPSGPSQVSNEPFEEVSGEATATAALPCPTLNRISLNVVPSVDAYVWVEATYHYSGPVMQPCPAPRWTSNRNQMVVNRENPMRAGFRRSAGGKATLTATAPNRVTKTIEVTIGPPPTRLASSIIPYPLPQACRDIAGVNVKIVPSPENDRHVWLVADYIYKRPMTGICTVAPVWKASRKGLHAAAFQASIGRRTTVRTTVTATAPNGKFDSITF